MDMNAEEKKIFNEIVNKKVVSGKVKAEDARKALQSDQWKQWLRDRDRRGDNDRAVTPIHGFNRDGQAVKAEKYNDRVVICWMYDTYLRMAQMNQRSQYSVAVDKTTGQVMKRLVIDMTFDEFLQDGLKNLDWIEREDLPMKRKFLTESPIGTIYGITEDEAKFTLELTKRLRESILKYMKMDEQEKLIYATDAVLFE